MDVTTPLTVALSAILPLGAALWNGNNDDAHSRAIGLRWALIALSLFLGAVGLYFAGDSKPFIYTVVAVLAIAVNALLISMLLYLRSAARNQPL
jgi:uncharacterized membrane protein YgaE (UPF0421/DUF939 family)